MACCLETIAILHRDLHAARRHCFRRDGRAAPQTPQQHYPERNLLQQTGVDSFGHTTLLASKYRPPEEVSNAPRLGPKGFPLGTDQVVSGAIRFVQSSSTPDIGSKSACRRAADSRVSGQSWRSYHNPANCGIACPARAGTLCQVEEAGFRPLCLCISKQLGMLGPMVGLRYELD